MTFGRALLLRGLSEPLCPGLCGRRKAEARGEQDLSPLAGEEAELGIRFPENDQEGRQWGAGPLGGLGGQTSNLSMSAAPFFFRGLRTRVGMRPGLVDAELSSAGLTALAQGGM